MQRELERIDWNKVLFFDIETVRGQEDLSTDDAIYSMVEWKFRDKATSERLPYEAVRERYLKEGGLHPALLKVVCISVGYIHDSTLRVKALVGDEKDIIEKFYSIAESRIMAGHNIKQFDIPVLRLRAFSHNIDIPSNLNDSGLAPWDIGLESKAKVQLIDSMAILKGTYYHSLSLEESCHLAGVQTPKTDINGSQVSEVYYSEGIDRIASYCDRDVLASANLILTLSSKVNIELDSNYVPPKQPSLGEKIYNTKGLTPTLSKSLIKLLEKKKLTKKDRVNFREMLLALVDNSTMFSKDKELDDKIKIIDNFLKDLK